MRTHTIVLMLFSAALFAQGAGDALRNRITETAQRYLGVPYIYGAESPSAFDCSGFVHFVYKNAAQLDLPRNSRQQWAAGSPIKLSEALPGDIIVFDTTGAGGPSHVAIFLGNEKLIHAISDGPKTGVVISTLADRYFGPRIIGYRLFLAPLSAAGKAAADEAAAKAAVKAAEEAKAAKAAQEAAAKAEADARAARAAQEAAAKAEAEARAARAAQEAAAKAVEEAKTAKAAEEARAARAAEEARAAKAAQEAAAKAEAEARAAKAAQEAAAKAEAEARTARAAQEAAAKAQAAAKAEAEAKAAKAAQEAAAKAAPPAPAAPAGPPIAQIGFDILPEKVVFTDKIPAATGTGIAFTLRNRTGKDGRFVAIFYKTAINFSDSKQIHNEIVNVPKDGAIEIPPYVFTEPGTYKLIVKDNWNTQLIERIFQVVELRK